MGFKEEGISITLEVDALANQCAQQSLGLVFYMGFTKQIIWR